MSFNRQGPLLRHAPQIGLAPIIGPGSTRASAL